MTLGSYNRQLSFTLGSMGGGGKNLSHSRAVEKLFSKNLNERSVSGLVTRELGVMDTLERV